MGDFHLRCLGQHKTKAYTLSCVQIMLAGWAGFSNRPVNSHCHNPSPVPPEEGRGRTTYSLQDTRQVFQHHLIVHVRTGSPRRQGRQEVKRNGSLQKGSICVPLMFLVTGHGTHTIQSTLKKSMRTGFQSPSSYLGQTS